MLPPIVGFQRAIEVHGPEDRAQRRVLCIARRAKPASVGLQARDHKPTASPSGVDQLLGCKARPGTEVCEVALHGAGPNAHELGRVRDRPAGGDVSSENVHLALRRTRRERAAQVPGPHARCLAAAMCAVNWDLIDRLGLDRTALAGQTALVTGGARGIGKGVAMTMAAIGAQVVVVDKRPTGQAVVDAIRAAGGQAQFIECDLSVVDELMAMIPR